MHSIVALDYLVGTEHDCKWVERRECKWHVDAGRVALRPCTY